MAFNNIKIVGDGTAQTALTNTTVLEGVISNLVAYNSTGGALSFSLFIDGVSVITEEVATTSSYRLTDKVNVPVNTVLTVNAPVGVDVTVSTYQGAIDTAAALTATQTSVQDADSARIAAELALDVLDDRYLGGFASDPTTDNDGNALVTGTRYYNSTTGFTNVYDEGLVAWVSMDYVPTDHLSLTNIGTLTHAELETSLDAKAVQATTYTKTETDTALGLKADQTTTYTKVESDTAISNIDLSVKQDVLVSGTNIKTVGGLSVVGAGDVEIPGGVDSYEYADRASLRALTPAAGDAAVVKGLGLFIWESGSTEPDDDESAFATTLGVWLLEAVSWDVVDAWQAVDDAVRDEFDEDSLLFQGKFLTGSATCAITSLVTLASSSFSGTVTGAVVGDRVIATPPSQLGSAAADTAKLAYHAWVSSADTVTVMLTNASASTATTNTNIQATWPITVIKS